MKRFILLIRTALSEEEKEDLAKALKEKFQKMECIDCTLVGACSVREKSKCPIQVHAENISYMKSDIYQAIRDRVDYIIMFPKVTFLCLVDTVKDIGYIYKGKEEIDYIKKYVLPSTIEIYEKTDGSELGVFELCDMRTKVGLVSPLLN